MSDNVAITPGSGATIGADEISTVKYQRVKLIHGADGTNDGDVSTANQLPVTTYGAATAAVTSVNDTATSTTLKALNAARKELIIQNDSTVVLYVKFGTTATTSDYTVKLAADGILTTQYTGRVDGIWASDASGAAKITELT